MLRDLVWRAAYGDGRRLASRARQRWVVFRHPRATIRFGRDVYLGPGFSAHIPDRGTLIVGDRAELRRGCRVEILGTGRIEIGADTHLTYDVLLGCSTRITIGQRCAIASNSAVYDANHRFRDPSSGFLEQGFDFFTVDIADDVLVHGLCTILADLGAHAVIGANSVVTKPVPPYTLAVGAPARAAAHFGPAEPPAARARSA